MGRNEDGEFELVLGNRQLLSVFFIVVILLGVFFTMGYIVGQNSRPAGASEIAAAEKGAAGVEGSGGTPQAGSQTQAPPAPLEPGGAKISPAEQAGAAETPPERAQSSPPPPVQTTPMEAKPSPSEPARGQTYLQVAAVKRPEAELIVNVLRNKKFPSLVAPGPSETVFRVLVGPLKDTATLARTRADLEAAGFKSIVRRY